ncbi:MAG: hypothetical protein ACK5KN_07555 [Dysgonomonas sp.]|uniref:hypothetical protein n=1 Tax=Dysgonomonas sp. TaxID=1891233 RepID=UPI003A873696
MKTDKTKDIIQKREMVWTCHTPRLIEEIVNCAIPRNMGILFQPLNIFKNYLAAIADRAAQINDPILNDIMCKMVLYEEADPYSKEYNPEKLRKVEDLARKERSKSNENSDR